MSKEVIWVKPYDMIYIASRSDLSVVELEIMLREHVGKLDPQPDAVQYKRDKYRDPNSFDDITRVSATLYRKEKE